MCSVRSEKGFALVELMVALGILAIGMAGVGAMLQASFQSDRFNAQQRRAEALSFKIFEKFKSGNPGAISGTDPCLLKLDATGKAAYTNEICIDETKRNGTFYVTWTSTPPPALSSGLTRLDVTVWWGGGSDCTYDDPTKCRRKVTMTSLYR